MTLPHTACVSLARSRVQECSGARAPRGSAALTMRSNHYEGTIGTRPKTPTMGRNAHGGHGRGFQIRPLLAASFGGLSRSARAWSSWA